jgi:hypothetical protein
MLIALPVLALVVHILPLWMFARLVGVLVAGGLLGWRLWWVTRARWDQRTYALTCVTVGTLWLLYATRTGLWSGLGKYSLLLFLVGWAPLSWLWWERHRVRAHHVTPDAVEAPDTDPFLTEWSGKVQPALKWTLSDPLQIDVGESYLLQLVPGQTIEDAEEAKKKLASLLRMSRDQFTFEPYTLDDGMAADDESLITMTVTPKHNPHLTDDQTWQGPTLDKTTGLYRHGVYPDGPAFLRLFKVENGIPHRACNSLWTGTTGAGKSRGNAIKVAEHLLSGMFAVWYADGKNGASAPELEGRVDWYCDTRDETIKMLRAAWRVMKVRARVIKKLQQAAFRGEKVIRLGSLALPFLQIVLDEAQEFLRFPIVAKLIKALLRMGNEVAMGVDLLTQVPLLNELGGDSGDGGAEVIRAMAKSGNVAVYKAEDSFSGRVTLTSDLAIDPKTLPRVPGSCFVAGHTARSAVCRTYYVTKDALHQWLQQAPIVSLDEASARAAGEDYATRHQRADEDDVAPEDIDLSDLDAELAILLGERLPGQDAPGTALDKLTVKQAVFKVVKAHTGAIRRDEIDSALASQGMTPSKSAIDQALAWWVDRGHMHRPERAVYDLITREATEPVPAGA